MNVKIEKNAGLTVAELNGELDGSTALPAQSQIAAAITPDSHLILDMSKVDFMSSAGLRMLLGLQRQLNAKGKLVLTGLSEQIQDTMTVTGFLDLFVVAESLAEAKALAA
jgi:anti-sigma B factor antagonist